MKGVFFSTKIPSTYEIRDFDVPKPDDDEVLIKNVAVASNPKDWKIIEWTDFEGIEGNDVCGHIEAVGKDVKGFSKGDKVAAFSKMATGDKYGAYAEYTVAPAHTTWHVAESTPFEDAATLPLAMMTAQIGLFIKLGLDTPPEDGSVASAKSETVVINGASSSVGAFAVQLAKRAGYSVVGVAGQSGDLAKELGADTVVDYRSKSDDELAHAVSNAAKQLGSLAAIYDAVSTDSTVAWLAQVSDSLGGGNITTVLPTKGESEPDSVPSGVKVVRTMVGSAYAEDTAFATKWYPLIGKWLDDGSFKANKVKLIPGGLDGVAEGMKLLKGGKVNGVKLVYRISETKSLGP